jgi:hypothetical protein
MTELTATLHDGTTMTAITKGAGPSVLLPVRTTAYDPATADTMRQWGGDPDLGPTLLHGLSDRFQVIAADYEGHRMEHPASLTLTPENLSHDLLAIADAGGAQQFAYYGYSWLALAGLQLAVRTDRLWALAMGGFPPADGPYEAMLEATRAAHRKASAPQEPVREPVTPGDWDSAGITVGSGVTGQYVTLYEALQGFDDDAAQRSLPIPRLAFAGGEDTITYGPGWGDTVVRISEPLVRHREALVAQGWSVEMLPGLDHLGAMESGVVLPLLRNWLVRHSSSVTATEPGTS